MPEFGDWYEHDAKSGEDVDKTEIRRVRFACPASRSCFCQKYAERDLTFTSKKLRYWMAALLSFEIPKEYIDSKTKRNLTPPYE